MTAVTCLLGAAVTTAFSGPLRVVTSTSDLAEIAREIGGDLVQTDVLCEAGQDPHAFEPLPRHVLVVQAADVYLSAGAGLDPWADKLIQSAGRTGLLAADCSEGIELLRDADCDHEHVHHAHDGNPHYALGPANLPRMAETVCRVLQRADTINAIAYETGRAAFVQKLDSAYAYWRTILQPCRGRTIASTHPSWDYFARDFDLQVAGAISNIPDHDPPPRAFAELLTTIRETRAVVILCEPSSAPRTSEILSRETGVPVLTAPTAAGGTGRTETIWALFHYLATEIVRHCQTP